MYYTPLVEWHETLRRDRRQRAYGAVRMADWSEYEPTWQIYHRR
jgi:hypothetical protein